MKKEILEGNKLIAEFMGYQILHKKYQYRNFNSSNESYFEEDEGEIVCDAKGNEVNLYENSDPLYNLEDLPFNSSFEWLMLAFDKIENMDFVTSIQIDKTKDTYLFPCTHACIFDGAEVEIIEEADTKFDAIYKAIIEFIKWYNEKSKV